jgi:hypothetical protein
VTRGYSKPLLGVGLAILDVLVVCILLHAGKSLQFSQLAGFGAVAASYWATLGRLTVRSRAPASAWWTAALLLSAAAAALLLRGAVLALLAGRCAWAPPFAILLAAPVGSALLLVLSAAVSI